MRAERAFRTARRSPRPGWHSLRTKGVVVVALPALALLGVTARLFHIEGELQAQSAFEAHADAVDSTTREVLQLLVDAETGVRGFAASDNPVFLEPEANARADLPIRLTQLRSLGDSSESRELIDAIERAAQRTLSQLATIKSSATDPSSSPARLTEAHLRGKALMDEVRGHTASLVRYEGRQRAEQKQALQKTEAENLLIAILLGAVGVGGGLLGSGLLMARIVQRVKAAERNAQLLAAGELPRATDAHQQDELGSLSRALADASLLIETQRRKLNLALEVGRINVWEADAAGNLVTIGARRDRYGGRLRDALATLRPSDADQISSLVSAVLDDGQPREYEVMSLADGRLFAGRVVPGDGDKVLGVSIDVTELRQAEEQLRMVQARKAAQDLQDSERRSRHNALLITSATEGIITIDTQGRCTSANPSAAAMLGYRVEELIGADLHELIHHSHPDGTPYPVETCPLRHAVSSRKASRVENEVFWRRDGSRLPIDYSAAPLIVEQAARGGVLTFSDASERRQASVALEVEAAAMRAGLAAGQFELHYQPKISLINGSIRSVESLVRWRRDGELTFPDSFIETAEQAGVIGELSDWVMREAASQVARWRDDGIELAVAVNLSGLSLSDNSIPELLLAAASSADIRASSIEVEITETAIAQDPTSAIAVLEELRRLGVHRSIDDFGTGYSSLHYLKTLPVSELKIDKTFVLNMHDDVRDQAIVAATVHMARSLGLRTVAEGVENPLALKLVRSAECDFGQGYHWSKPLPANELVVWLDAYRRRRNVSDIGEISDRMSAAGASTDDSPDEYATQVAR